MINLIQHPSEEKLFMEGPRSRLREFIFAFKVFFQFIKGFRKFHFLGPCATVFGSARFGEGHVYYEMTRHLGSELSRLGFTVMTGGGPGLMEAANRGAREANGKSVGCNIVLPQEQEPNRYLDRWVGINYFFVRKVLLSKYSYAFVVMPGGYGTLDEFFESLTLIQTNKVKKFPVVLMGKEYHVELMQHMDRMVASKTISSEDKALFLFTDSVEEAVQHLEKNAVERFGLRTRRKYSPWRFLGEK